MDQNPAMVTSFADGSKLSSSRRSSQTRPDSEFAHAGCREGSIQRLDHGHRLALRLDEVRGLGGIVDYTVGPSDIKVFCLAEHADPKQRRYLGLTNSAKDPLSLLDPYHLPHFETPNAIARVALLGDVLAPPLAGPIVEVCAVAKRDLKADEVLDEYGMHDAARR